MRLHGGILWVRRLCDRVSHSLLGALCPFCREAQGAPTPSPFKLSSATVRADLVVRPRGAGGGPLARLQAATACPVYIAGGRRLFQSAKPSLLHTNP